MKNPKSASEWQKSIEVKSRRTFQYLYIPLAILTGVLIVFAYAIVTYLPEGGEIFGLMLTNDFVDTLSFLMGVLGVSGAVSTVLAIRKRIEPAFRRYNDAAREIVDEVVTQLCLDKTVKMKMLDVITSELSPCTDPSLGKECKEGLKRASIKLSKLIP